MAKLVIQVNACNIGDVDNSSEIGIDSYTQGEGIDKQPVLDFVVGEGINDSICFLVTGYDDIDALRCYCEMTLDLFEKGRLE